MGLSLVGMGVFWWRSGGESDNKVEILNMDNEVKGASVSAWMIVDIAGAVKNPGLYSFEEEARIGEVIEKAGGLTNEADNNWIDMYLNRSAKIVDGQKIYIPKITLNKQQEMNPKTQTSTDVQVKSSLININTATSGELDGLPGVGPATAGKIISGRPYTRLEELREKKIVSQKVYDQIKDSISLW
jgi:competence protein ComEA